MNLSPELQLLIFHVVIMAVAYGGIYPSMKTLTIERIVMVDLALINIGLAAMGGLLWGSGVSFSLILFETNWVVFILLTGFVMELPLFHWFCKKHGLTPFRMDDD